MAKIAKKSAIVGGTIVRIPHITRWMEEPECPRRFDRFDRATASMIAGGIIARRIHPEAYSGRPDIDPDTGVATIRAWRTDREHYPVFVEKLEVYVNDDEIDDLNRLLGQIRGLSG